ncbi:hypothetical protein [Thalassotalea ganghwensis]
MGQADVTFEQLADRFEIKYTIDKQARIMQVSHLGRANIVQFAAAVKEFASHYSLNLISVKIKQQQAIYLFQQGFHLEAPMMAFDGCQDTLDVVYQCRDNQNVYHTHQRIPAPIVQSLSFKNNQRIPRLEDKFAGFPVLSLKHQHIFISQDHDELVQHNNKQRFYAHLDGDVVATADAIRYSPDNIVEYLDFNVQRHESASQVLYLLLSDMTEYYQTLGVITAYALIPVSHLAINRLFLSRKFEFGGQLANHINVEGKVECLNTWFKTLTLEGKSDR